MKGRVSHPRPAQAQRKEQTTLAGALLPYVTRDRLIPNCSHPDLDAMSFPLPIGHLEEEEPTQLFGWTHASRIYECLYPGHSCSVTALITAPTPTPEVKSSFTSLDQCWVTPTAPFQTQAGSWPRSCRQLCWVVLVTPCRSCLLTAPQRVTSTG